MPWLIDAIGLAPGVVVVRVGGQCSVQLVRFYRLSVAARLPAQHHNSDGPGHTSGMIKACRSCCQDPAALPEALGVNSPITVAVAGHNPVAGLLGDAAQDAIQPKSGQMTQRSDLARMRAAPPRVRCARRGLGIHPPWKDGHHVPNDPTSAATRWPLALSGRARPHGPVRPVLAGARQPVHARR